MKIKLRLLLGLFSISLMPACRTHNGPDSSVKDEQTDLLKEVMPSGLVSIPVPSEDIPKHVAVATGDNGIPSSLNGIWWTDAKSVQFIVSFKNAAWNTKTRTASLVFSGPGTYSVPTKSTNKRGLPAEGWENYAGYDIVFDSTLRQAKMLKASSSYDGDRDTEDPGYKLVFVEDGVWRRDTPGSDSYLLRRIVDENGNKEAAFQDMLRKFGPLANVLKASISIKSEKPSAKISVKAGIPSYLSLLGTEGAKPNPYNLIFKAPFPTRVQSFTRSHIPQAQSGENPLTVMISGYEESSFATILAEQDGEVEVSLEQAPPFPVLEMGKATSVNLKANQTTFFRISELPVPNQFKINVQSDSPTDIGFQRNRSAGRAGQKMNSLWAAAEKELKMEFDNETIILRAQDDTLAVVELVPTEIKRKARGMLKSDGSWQEASLETLNTVDIWEIDPGKKKSGAYVEIEELDSKKDRPELALRATRRDENLNRMITFGDFLRDGRVSDDEYNGMKRKVPATIQDIVTVNYALSQQLGRLLRYRIRVIP